MLMFEDIKPGDRLRADDGFPCLHAGEIVEVKVHKDGDLYVDCHDPELGSDHHFLDGQLGDNGECVGFELVTT